MPGISKAAREEASRLLERGLKRCTRCASTLPTSEFGKRKSSWDGLRTYCKRCECSITTEGTRRNRDKWTSRTEDPYSHPEPKRCYRCSTSFPRSEFFRDCATSDGLQRVCKGCAAILRSEHRRDNLSKWRGDTDPYSAPSLKHCGGCDRDLPRAEFAISATLSDGLQARCRECGVVWAASARSTHRFVWSSEGADPYSDPTPKKCGECDQLRPRSDFSTQPSRYDGLDPLCRGCASSKTSARRAQLLGQWVEYVDRSIAWNQAGGICYLCSIPCDADRWDLDHVDPIVNGGEHSYFNTAPTHPECNRSKGGKPWPDVSWPEGDEILARLSP